MATQTIINNHKISNFDFLNAFVLPNNGTTFFRGFAIMPRKIFEDDYGIECTFMVSNAWYWVDIKYISDTLVSVGTNYSTGVFLILNGMICGEL